MARVFSPGLVRHLCFVFSVLAFGFDTKGIKFSHGRDTAFTIFLLKFLPEVTVRKFLDFMYLDTEYLKYYDFYGKRSQRRATDREREGRFKRCREEARCNGSSPVQRLLSIQRTTNYFNVFFSTS